MNETQVTVVGNVATAVKGGKLPNGDTVARFRVASTERRRGPGGEWANGASLFVSVTCWRQLAENVLASFGVGDPIVVRGRLYTHDYEWEGKRRSEIRLDGFTAGPDLSRCSATIVGVRRGEPAAGPAAGEHDERRAGTAVGDDQPSDDQRERLGARVEAGVRA